MVKWFAALFKDVAEIWSGRLPGDSFRVENERKKKRESAYEAWKKEHGSDWDELK